MEKLSNEKLEKHSLAENCYLCKNKFTMDDKKVMDHCHISGEYRGAAHNSCNLKCKTPNYIPVLIHNLSGYDSHFIVKQLGCSYERVEVIPSSEECYISFSKYVGAVKLRFIDSFRFMPASLENLVSNLPELPETRKYFGENNSKLLSRKGVFPYDYVDCWEKLEEKELPKKDHFYNKLNELDISDDDYEYARKVWEHFNIKNLGEYSDLYLVTDVLLLADVFEALRDSTIESHSVDPAHYFTIPGLTWDAMLKFTGIELELLLDYEQLLMVESGIRGGICQVSHRHAEANNKYLEGYDTSKPSQYITYEDANNQYGWAMSHYLPYGGFKWVPPDSINLDEMREDDPIGYILEVDVEYPDELHDLHNDFPFLPETRTPPDSSFKKLIPHLGARKYYVVHYMALKQALDHGLKLTKIHRVLKFNQSPWLKSYVEFNNHLRTKAKNDFEKDLFKLFNNAMFGKTMESVRKRMDLRLVTNWKQMEKLMAKPTFLDRTIYGENLVAVHLAKRKILFDKPIYIGMCILDISKTLMYRYHYDVLLPHYGPEKIKLMYTDTDSFIHLIQTDDIYRDKLNFMEYLDTSEYPSDHPCYSNINKKVLGKFKDEAIIAFAGLRAKMYSIKISEKEVIKKAKGVKKCSLRKHIEFKDYVDCINSGNPRILPMNLIMSKDHNVCTYKVNKLSLSPFDDK
ncbi:uncharacterized protein LOC128896552, partial [Hylaeus anthracinus]|uniref:uncharacterized protein LOC128896552 n=1 Tax=Hylaeus anthracinus TaxID=313031 RepID=UPI0023B990C9